MFSCFHVSIPVAANILKLVENPSQKKLVFTLVRFVCVCVCVRVCIGCNNIHSSLLYTQGNVPQSQLDGKKLIGYAQLNIIE